MSDDDTKNDGSSTSFKLIRTTTGSIRVSQACDRCRIKKIKCDGLTPCHNCSKIGFECKTSDKLRRRAFPKGYTENLEKELKKLEQENKQLRQRIENAGGTVEGDDLKQEDAGKQLIAQTPTTPRTSTGFQPNQFDNNQAQQGNRHDKVTLTNTTNVQINNPIDQMFNLDGKGIIIGNDNLNFESQFNRLLINLNLPFLKITNSHNFLLNDPNSYLYHPSYTKYNRFHNRDLDVIYNPLTANNSQHDDLLGEMVSLANNQLPIDIYDFFIKLINNFKKLFNSKRELDNQIIQFFLNYNVFIPIFDFKQFMESYDAFHTMYPFMFTYDDATINGFNISNNDYHVVNEYVMVVVQIYAMIMMNDPTINLNLLLNHSEPKYINNKKMGSTSVIRSLYDFLPYFNVFHVSVSQLQTYLLFLHYSLITNNKEKSLVLSAMINSFIGILGINLNSKNLFFNDLTLTIYQKRTRVKIFWCFKILLKVFNLKFGFKPSLNTTVINPVTIDRYFELTPSKLSMLLDEGENDELFRVLLKPSIEFLNLVNIIIPSSFSPNYYQYLKGDNDKNEHHPQKHKKSSRLDWILNDDDGDGNDGNLNYNYNQFLTIDRNLTNWRETLKDRELDLIPLQIEMNLPVLSGVNKNNLYHSIPRHDKNGKELRSDEEDDNEDEVDGDDNHAVNIPPALPAHAMQSYLNSGLPDTYSASQLIKIQLNFHYLLIRSMNYLNFVIDKELTSHYYHKIKEISREVLAYFIVLFEHVGQSNIYEDTNKATIITPHNAVMESLGLDVDEDGFVINDFSVKRRRVSHTLNQRQPNQSATPTSSSGSGKKLLYELPKSPFNCILNGLSMTIINLKKSVILQMLYLLICCLKVFKKGEERISKDIKNILNTSVDLFIKVFINYNPETKEAKRKNNRNNQSTSSSLKEIKLFNKLMNDELKDEILKEPRKSGTDDSDEDDSDEEMEDNGDEFSEIDWDDEDMDEDLKYMKILKFIKYKINNIYTISKYTHRKSKDKKKRKNSSSRKNKPGSSNVAAPGGSGDSSHRSSNTNLPDGGHPHNSRGLGGDHLGSGTMIQQPLTLYGGPSPPNYGSNTGLSKMPSLTNFLLGEDNYMMRTTGSATRLSAGPTYPSVNKLKEFNGNPPPPQSNEDLELIKKERLVINDLLSMKKQQHKGAGSPVFQANWNTEGERK